MKSSLKALLLGAVLLLPQAVNAQLINIDKNYRITKVDYAENRIEVQYLNSQTATIFVDVDGNTQVMIGHHRIPWKHLQRGWIVQVKGGLEPGLHIKGKTIIVHST